MAVVSKPAEDATAAQPLAAALKEKTRKRKGEPPQVLYAMASIVSI